MKYINYYTIVFAFLLGSCSQQKQITKTPDHQTNTVATNPVIDTVKEVAISQKDTGNTYAIDPRGYYEDAYEHLQQMFRREQPLNFKKAVFVTENAWYQNQLSYDAYNNYINALASICKAWDKANPLLNYNWDFDSIQVALNGAIYHVMTDTVKDEKGNIVSTPYHYDFNDCFAKDNWTSMFVTKLMLTHGGNCHSLPFLYKILSEELGTKAYLSMLPEHIYINQYARKTSWYNTELTGRCFPVDAWLMSTGYVSVQSIRTRLYMDTLSLQESIAICVNDLAKGYERKFGDGDYKFILKCCDLGLTYYPTYGELLLLKAETLKKLYQSKIAEYGLNAPDSKEHGEEIHSIYDKMEQTYNRLAKLDYREIPEALYSHWTDAMINGGKAENENIHDTILYVTVAGKKQGIITYSYGDSPVFFNPEDTTRRIGSVIFNTRRHRVESFILKDDYAYEKDLQRPQEPARFLSVDPIAKQFPELSPYQYAGDKPIWATDLDGKEPAYSQENTTLGTLYVPASDQIQHTVPQDASYIKDVQTPSDPNDIYHQIQDVSDGIVNTFKMAFTGYDDNGNKVSPSERAEAIMNVAIMGVGGPEGEGISGEGFGEGAPKSGDYGNLKDSKTVGPGKDFTASQKQKILAENKAKNGGVIKSDLSGKIANKAVQAKKGVKADMNQAEIDHVIPKSKGGKNSYKNAQVLTKKENLQKAAKTTTTKTTTNNQ